MASSGFVWFRMAGGGGGQGGEVGERERRLLVPENSGNFLIN